MTSLSRLASAALLAVTIVVAIPFAGIAADLHGAMIGQRAVGVASVEAIDRQTREITLKVNGGTAAATSRRSGVYR